MKIVKSFYFLLFFIFPGIIFGCARFKPNLSRDLVTVNYREFFGSYPEPGMGFSREILPKILQEDPLTSKIDKAINESYRNMETSKVIITKNDLITMNKMLVNNFGVRNTNMSELTSDNKFLKVVRKYFMEYFTDGFIDREGTVYKPPDYKTGIESDAIGQIFTIFLEAFFDCKFNMPVFYDGEVNNPKWMTKTGKEPTAGKYMGMEKIVSKDKQGITENELKLIWFLSGITGDQSKVLSGIVYRLLGSVQLGVVVLAGNFSIGGNDTLARIFDELMRVTGKRTVEYACYEYFRKTPKSLRRTDTPAAVLLAEIEELTAQKRQGVR